jgi:hypothetical protein
MRYAALWLGVGLTACESLPQVSKEPPMKVLLQDVFVGQDIHGEGAKETFLFIKAEFVVQDQRPAMLTDLSYVLFVGGTRVGAGRAQQDITIRERRMLDFTLRNTEMPPEEAVKIFQAKGGKLHGTIRYKMIDGGMYDVTFEAPKTR